MKLLILDYMRRWRWVYIFAAIVLPLFWTSLLVGGQNPTTIPVALYFGAVLLSADLARCTAKCAYTSPLSRKQIGNAWWLLATLLPVSINLAAKLLAGAISSLAPSHSQSFLSWLALSTAIDFTYAGTMFFLLTFMPAPPTSWTNQNVRASIFAILWMLGSYGLLFQNKYMPAVWLDVRGWSLAGLLAALGLTVAGYLRSTQLVVFRASYRTTDQTAASGKASPQTSSWDRQLVGLRQIFWTTFVGSLQFSLLIFGGLVLTDAFISSPRSNGQMQGTFPVWAPFLLMMQNLRWTTTLRHLRVLPLSVTQLNGVLLGLMTTSVITVGLFANVSHALLPSLFRWNIPPHELVCLAGGCCFLAAIAMDWGKGAAVLACVALLFVFVLLASVISTTILGNSQAWMNSPSLPLLLCLVGVVLGAVGAWLNQRALIHQKDVYKPTETFFGQAWGK